MQDQDQSQKQRANGKPKVFEIKDISLTFYKGSFLKFCEPHGTVSNQDRSILLENYDTR